MKTTSFTEYFKSSLSTSDFLAMDEMTEMTLSWDQEKFERGLQLTVINV